MKENIHPYKGRHEPPEGDRKHHVISVNSINESAYILRFTRNGIPFTAGQYLSLGLPSRTEMREYSIFSSEDQAYFEVLIREVEEGSVSRQLRKLKPGDEIRVDGPFGFFTLPEGQSGISNILFIASGTGISPFHSIATSNPELDYILLHGVRTDADAFARGDFVAGRHVLCTSRDQSGEFHGRVTDWLKANPVSAGTLCYLCGNCEMIYDCFDILESQGVPPQNLHAEVYF